MSLDYVDDKSEEVTEEVWEGYIKVFDRPVMSIQKRRAAFVRERRAALLHAIDSIMEDDLPETDGHPTF